MTWVVAALICAIKKLWAALIGYPVTVGLYGLITVADVSLIVGPHVMAATGGVIGTVVRFHLLKMRWKSLPIEAGISALTAFVFGSAQIPIISAMLERTPPEMLPVAQGATIGILMAGGTGFLRDFIEVYGRKIKGGDK